jgi:hypothetical protein
MSSLSAATEGRDRRMNSLIEIYQGVFAGTRIATLGFAMTTAGLALPGANRPGRRNRGRPEGSAPIPRPVPHGLSEGEIVR